ncbi:unnamed protein product, partial [Phaeothamnion confervicola]
PPPPPPPSHGAAPAGTVAARPEMHSEYPRKHLFTLRLDSDRRSASPPAAGAGAAAPLPLPALLPGMRLPGPPRMVQRVASPRQEVPVPPAFGGTYGGNAGGGSGGGGGSNGDGAGRRGTAGCGKGMARSGKEQCEQERQGGSRQQQQHAPPRGLPGPPWQMPFSLVERSSGHPSGMAPTARPVATRQPAQRSASPMVPAKRTLAGSPAVPHG